MIKVYRCFTEESESLLKLTDSLREEFGEVKLFDFNKDIWSIAKTIFLGDKVVIITSGDVCEFDRMLLQEALTERFEYLTRYRKLNRFEYYSKPSNENSSKLISLLRVHELRSDVTFRMVSEFYRNSQYMEYQNSKIEFSISGDLDSQRIADDIADNKIPKCNVDIIAPIALSRPIDKYKFGLLNTSNKSVLYALDILDTH